MIEKTELSGVVQEHCLPAQPWLFSILSDFKNQTFLLIFSGFENLECNYNLVFRFILLFNDLFCSTMVASRIFWYLVRNFVNRYFLHRLYEHLLFICWFFIRFRTDRLYYLNFLFLHQVLLKVDDHIKAIDQVSDWLPCRLLGWPSCPFYQIIQMI